jgi:isopenicillin N synthase-like dioxygenase
MNAAIASTVALESPRMAPGADSVLGHIPVIELGALRARSSALVALDAACREWGFFQLAGHGIPRHRVRALHDAMHAFFALPEPALRAIERSERNHWGYYDRELTKNRRDAKRIFDVGPAEHDGPLAGIAPQWPDALPGFRHTIETWSAMMHAIGGQLLEAIATCLGVPTASLRAGFEPRHGSFLRLNHYPPVAQPRGEFGVHAHTDAGALTLLLQDAVPGLQVLRDDGWHTVPPRADTLLVNIGDIVQVWSNDRYRAPVHRVLGSGLRERYSGAWFHNPVGTLDYAPLPGTIAAGDRPHYRPINWGAFRAARAAGDYADRGEEVQVGHFREGARAPGVYRESEISD